MSQHTVSKEATFAGVGLHSGKVVKLTIKPAPVNHGIRFVRVDRAEKPIVPASMCKVHDTQLATTLSQDDVLVGTTEHLLSALSGLEIDNAIVELNGDEVPIMDGSAAPFVRMLKGNRRKQHASRLMMKIVKDVVYRQGDSEVRVSPHKGFKVTCRIDFDHSVIKDQRYTLEVKPDSYLKEISRARTFGFLEQVEYLRAHGKALGGSLDNAVVIDKNGVVNEEGLRFGDEFARHKVLDLIGDLTLLGCPILGHVQAYKGGHTQHLAFMEALAANPDSWQLVDYSEDGRESVLDKVRLATLAAGKKILPFLVPPCSPAPVSQAV
ncbi:MAG: UDP-3-O-acyl-N-acetylglucosamine deacetylase [Thermodesulfobacteriota bacterium]